MKALAYSTGHSGRRRQASTSSRYDREMNTETASTGQPTVPQGSMLFYRQPEFLNHEFHGALGLRRPERPFEFARQARVLPLTITEIPSAQKHFPVIFSDLEEPMPLAVVGSADDVNLFVDDEGNWEGGTYIPAYARCYPFALAARSEEEFAVIIDRAAPIVSDDPEQPFFDGDKVTPETQSLIDFCAQYDAELQRTRDFGMRLKEFDVLSGQQIMRNVPNQEAEPIARYFAVDSDKLGELDSTVVKEFFDKGYLAAIFAHLFSLENWQRVMERGGRWVDPGAAKAN